MKIKLFIIISMLVLALTGCPNNTSTDTTAPINTNTSTKITGLQANVTLNAYIGETQYSIALNSKTGEFNAEPIEIHLQNGLIRGRGDSDETAQPISGTFVCNKTAAGDNLFWYEHDTDISLKPNTKVGSSDCYKITADLTNPDVTADASKYRTVGTNTAAYTAAETAAKTTSGTTGVSFTDKQKKILATANTQLAKCSKKTASSLAQTFSTDGDATKDCTVGFTFNLGDTTCDVFIDKDNVAISTDNTTDFSRSTPTWLMSAVKTVIASGASPDDLKNYTNLKGIISEMASAVSTSNDDVVYATETRKAGYEVPCPWNDDELAKMKKFTENYASHKKEIGAYIHGYMSNQDKDHWQVIEKFTNEDAFAADSNGKRTKAELIYILSYSTITGFFPNGNYANDDEHVFGITVTVDLDGINALLPLNEWTHPSVIYDYFTFSEAKECYSDKPVTWRITTDFETNQDTIEPVTHYEKTPQWFLDMITTYTSKDHTDYDRQFNIDGPGCPLADIGSLWLDDICDEYLNGPGSNRYRENKFIFNVYERDLTTDTYPSTPTKQMEIKEIKALVASGDYAAYADDVTDDWTATSMANLWNDYEDEAKDADGHTLQDGVKPTSYTTTYYGQSPIYMKKILYNVVYQQRSGDTFINTGRIDKLTVSEIKELMETWKNAGCKLFLWNDGTSQWTGEYENGNWQIYTTTGGPGWSSPTNNTVYFLQTDSN
ncbi:MAG: hypothetical protein IKQ61_08540 [Spirochaetales bacterium]|nr:hypothetical protein [Spirochaetales bacterium]